MSRTIPESQQASPPFVLQKSFSLPVLPPIHELNMTLDCSDAVGIFLNGNSLYRSPQLRSPTAIQPYSTASKEQDEALELIVPSSGLLQEGKNNIVVFVYQRSASDSRTRFDLSLRAGTIAGAKKLQLATIPLQSFGTFKARARKEGRWSALVEEDYSITIPHPAPGGIKISEISFNPNHPMTPAEKAAAEEAREFEYVAITNPGPNPYHLSRMRLSEAIEFQFPRNAIILPQSTLYLVRDSKAFRARFGESKTIAGEFRGRLNNAGELIRLTNRENAVVDEVVYQTSSPWPVQRKDQGMLLRRIIDSEANDGSEASSWERAPELSSSE